MLNMYNISNPTSKADFGEITFSAYDCLFRPVLLHHSHSLHCMKCGRVGGGCGMHT